MTNLEQAVERVTRHLDAIDVAAMPTRSEVFIISGGPARELHASLRLILNALSQREGEIERLRGALEKIISADREIMADSRKRGGLADCVDNTGQAYQSQWLGEVLAKARAVLQPGRTP